MKTAAELWADTIKKQPIDDLTIKHTCESIEELINKKTTGVRLAGLLSRAEAIILRQRKEIAALHKAAEVEHGPSLYPASWPYSSRKNASL